MVNIQHDESIKMLNFFSYILGKYILFWYIVYLIINITSVLHSAVTEELFKQTHNSGRNAWVRELLQKHLWILLCMHYAYVYKYIYVWKKVLHIPFIEHIFLSSEQNYIHKNVTCGCTGLLFFCSLKKKNCKHAFIIFHVCGYVEFWCWSELSESVRETCVAVNKA